MGDGAEGSSSSVALSWASDLLGEWSALPNPPRCCPTHIITYHPHRSVPLIPFPVLVSSCDHHVTLERSIIVIHRQSLAEIAHPGLIFLKI